MRLLIANLLAVALGFTGTSLYLAKDKAKQAEEKYELVIESLRRENVDAERKIYDDITKKCINEHKFTANGKIIVCYTEQEK